MYDEYLHKFDVDVVVGGDGEEVGGGVAGGRGGKYLPLHLLHNRVCHIIQ